MILAAARLFESNGTSHPIQALADSQLTVLEYGHAGRIPGNPVLSLVLALGAALVQPVLSTLKGKLGRHLDESRRRGVHYLPKAHAADVTVDGRSPKELRVIEDVEGFHVELEHLAFGNS